MGSSLLSNSTLGRASVKEAPTLIISLISFNILNHQNDGSYIGVISSPFFGRPVAALPPRRIQLNLKFKFYLFGRK